MRSPPPGIATPRSASCARPSARSTRAGPSATATRPGASCGGSARARSRAGRRAGDAIGLASLSRREREIADLVRDRKTNREIAAELFLSEKTVESHLRNVFAKLGASSRVDVARAVERSGRV